MRCFKPDGEYATNGGYERLELYFVSPLFLEGLEDADVGLLSSFLYSAVQNCGSHPRAARV